MHVTLIKIQLSVINHLIISYTYEHNFLPSSFCYGGLLGFIDTFLWRGLASKMSFHYNVLNYTAYRHKK